MVISRHSNAASRRFRSDVEKAVALFYEQGGESAPRVVAKGTGRFAEQLIGIAFANGVKVRKDADLAEILLQLDIDSEIPVEVFAAVAEILSYVYRANGTLMEATGTVSKPDTSDILSGEEEKASQKQEPELTTIDTALGEQRS